MFHCFEGSGGFVAGGGDLGYLAFQCRVGVYPVFRQEVQRLCGLFQVVELRPLLIALRLREPQEVVKVFGLRDGGVNGRFTACALPGTGRPR